MEWLGSFWATYSTLVMSIGTNALLLSPLFGFCMAAILLLAPIFVPFASVTTVSCTGAGASADFRPLGDFDVRFDGMQTGRDGRMVEGILVKLEGRGTLGKLLAHGTTTCLIFPVAQSEGG